MLWKPECLDGFGVIYIKPVKPNVPSQPTTGQIEVFSVQEMLLMQAIPVTAPHIVYDPAPDAFAANIKEGDYTQ